MITHQMKRSAGVIALGAAGLSTVAVALWSPQITVQTPKNSPNTVSVKFKQAQAASVELMIDGVAVAYRDLNGRVEGALNFSLQGLNLAPGYHDATINLYDAAGNLVARSQQRLNIPVDPTALITMSMPLNGSTVSGTVEVKVNVRGNAQSKSYVSFFVDGQFRTLRNFAPYVYQWDTQQETNGWHTVEAWSFDGNQTLKATPTRVNVNNPGGRTDREAIVWGDSEPATSTEPSTALKTSEKSLAPRADMAFGSGDVRMMEDARLNPPTEIREAKSAPVIAKTAPTVKLGEAASTPTITPRTSRPVDSAITAPVKAGSLAPKADTRTAPAQPEMTGQKLHKPQLALNAKATNAIAKAAPVTAKTNAPAKPWAPMNLGARVPKHVQHFNVLFDTTVLTFDVQPRAQNQIPLAPIRHIWEHANGTVEWEHSSKTVTAQNDARTVILQIGRAMAQINGQSVEMEVAPFIVNGRTLVPISFLPDALNVEAFYDPNTDNIVLNTLPK